MRSTPGTPAAGASLNKSVLSLTAAAARLEVAVSSVSGTMNQPTRPGAALRIFGLAGYNAEGLLYRIAKG